MSAKRILVVDDEPDFARFMEDILKREGFVVSVAGNGLQALKMVAESRPDAILLDWNLPGKDGIEVCRTLKVQESTKNIPILMLTVRGRETDAVLGLEMGADDYITKRVLRPRELVARVHAALRKTAVEDKSGRVLRSGKLVVDVERRLVTVAGEVIPLRPKEFDLLQLFLEKRGRVLTRNFLNESVWHQPYLSTSRVVDTTVTRLRGKIGKEGDKIFAITGIGYKFEDDPNALP
jgi:DNA-binding response OmpR family regulator